jgi:response regulator of citrate/malate metabolism
MNKYRGPILVIEDEPLTKEEMEKLFPYTFIITKSSQEALSELYKTPAISLIILDDYIKDPITLLKIIRSQSSNIPVFMMTASLSMKTNAINSGVTGFIYPPFDVENIEKVLSTYCMKKNSKENTNKTY